MDLNYVSFGNWIDVTGNNNDFATGVSVFGIRTETNDVPGSGQATYSGETVGTMVNSSGTIYTVAGYADLTANFGAGTVDGNFTQMGALDVLTQSISPWRDFTTTGNINGNTFSGTANTNDGVLSGTSSGAFFGPGAAEIGGVWRMIGGGEQAVGAFVGSK